MFALSSPAFSDGQPIPARYANPRVRGGRNVSPPLEWADPPDGTRSFALSVVDHAPVARMWVHWLVVNIPADAREIPEGASRSSAMPAGAEELAGTGGDVGWAGPVPPVGTGPHDYVFTLYALDAARATPPRRPTAGQFEQATKGVLGRATLTGTFEQ